MTLPRQYARTRRFSLGHPRDFTVEYVAENLLLLQAEFLERALRLPAVDPRLTGAGRDVPER